MVFLKKGKGLLMEIFKRQSSFGFTFCSFPKFFNPKSVNRNQKKLPHLNLLPSNDG